MSLTLALQTALSGIQANQAALQVAANNIANVNTVGFTKKTVEFEARRVDVTGAGVNISDITRSVDEFLLRQVREQGGTVAALSAREKFLSQIQGIFGTPNSGDTVAAGLTKLNNNFETLALTPESDSARFEAVNEARKLAVQLNQLSDAIQTLRADADQAVTVSTAEITNQLQIVEDLNAQIALAVALNEESGGLRDQRDVALATISKNLDIRTFEASSGKVSIFTGSGKTLLSEGTTFTLSHTSAAQTDANVAYARPGDANYPGSIDGIFVGTPDLVNGSNDITTQITDGELKGLIDARDTLLPNLQKEIDQLTAVLKTQINTFHNQGTAFPPPATLTGSQTFAATDAFSGTGSARIAVLNQTTGAVVEFVDVNLAALGATATVTRAGSFRPDANGNLANTAGQFLTGWPIVNGAVQQTSIFNAFSTVNISSLTSAPIETSTIDIGANLPSAAATNDTFDLSVEALDKQGGSHALVLTFTKTAVANQWDITATAANASFLDIDANNDGAAGDNALIAGTTSTRLGTIAFAANGTLASVTASTAAGDISTVTANNFVFDLDYDNALGTGVADDRVPITLDLGTVGLTDGLTQFAGTFVPNFINQNGRQFGSITGVTVADDGTVTALFDNGDTRDIFQVPLAVFPNPNGLIAQTGNVFNGGSEAGTPVALAANSGGAGVIASNALEASTVDLADEFTRMIVTQRAFSANTKIITTADEMLAELTNIIR